MSNDKPKLPIALKIAMIVVPLGWVISGFITYKIMPDWTTRGQLGDMFGMANSFFSSLAFLGLIYTVFLQQRQLDLQRKDSIEANESFQLQIKEMQLSRIQAAQPLPIVTLKKITVIKPRLFYSPPEDEYLVTSKYRVGYSIANSADYPAVNVDVKSVIVIPKQGTNIPLNSIAHRFNILTKTKLRDRNSREEFDYHENNGDMCFLEALRSGKLGDSPLLFVRVTYKNMLGSCFGITEGYSLDISSAEQDNDLSCFQSAIRTFSVEYKNEIEQLRRWKKSHNDEKWDALFQDMKEKVGNKEGSDEILLRWKSLPKYSKFEVLEEAAFEKEQKETSYGRPIPLLFRGCHATKEGKSEEQETKD